MPVVHATSFSTVQVMFDPHCAHLPAISVNNPGKKLDFVAQPLADRCARVCALTVVVRIKRLTQYKLWLAC